jgi:hypothetical protein
MRAFKTLRDFLELLETDKQLLRITDAVSPEPDLAAAGRAINQAGGETSPALLFNNIKGLMLGMEKDASLKAASISWLLLAFWTKSFSPSARAAACVSLVSDSEAGFFGLTIWYQLVQQLQPFGRKRVV